MGWGLRQQAQIDFPWTTGYPLVTEPGPYGLGRGRLRAASSLCAPSVWTPEELPTFSGQLVW